MNDSLTNPDFLPPAEVDRAGCLLLDVRTPAEYAQVHVPEAVLLPLHELEPTRVAALARGKSGCVVLCRSGSRARQAAEKLRAAGVPRVAVVEGGMQAWEAAGLPVNRGRGGISLERQVRMAAGALVLVGVGLGVWVAPAWLGLAAFVGAGLVFAGATDTCGMALILARMPWNNGRRCANGACAIQ